MGDHHDDLDLLLPDHPPEQVLGGGHGALGRNVRLGPPEPVHEVCVEVLVLLLEVVQGPGGASLSQPHPSVIN